MAARRPPAPLAALAALALLAASCSGRPATGARHGRQPSASTSTGAATSAPAPASPAEWTAYGGGPARASADLAEGPLPGSPSVAWTSPALDGPVYGQPLVFGGQVLVATEQDTIYALGAADGRVAWSLHLGDPVPAGALACGDIAPTVGVTSTMVVDPSTRTLYASAALRSGGAVVHQLVAVDLTTHALRFRRVLDQPGWDAAAQLQRAGLALDGGLVLAGFGGNYGDCGRYNGWVIGVPVGGTGPLAAYRVPASTQGAVWAPPGPAIDAAGDAFVATGNGSAGPGSGFDHGDSVVALSSQLQELQYFAPAAWAQDNAADADLGSTSPVLIGGGRLFQVGKQAVGYLLATAHLGGVGPGLASLGLCNARGAVAYEAPDLFVPCPDTGRVLEARVGPGDVLRRGWTWTSPTGGASSPTVARGLLWVVDPGAAVLYAVDPATGATRASLPLRTGQPAHFAAPSAGEGLVVVAGSRAVEAFR